MAADRAGRPGSVQVAEGQLADALDWLQSADARAAAAAELGRLGLRGDDAVDDLLGDVALSVLRRVQRLGPLDDHPDGSSDVVSHCRRSVRHAAIDLARGPRHLHLEDLVGEQEDDDRVPILVGGEAPAEAVAGALHADHLVAAARIALFLSLDARRTWRWAAALALLSVARNPETPLREGTPEPSASAADQRPLWAALHYAGRSECFSDQGGPPDPACRMRRTTAMRQVASLLQVALSSAVVTSSAPS